MSGWPDAEEALRAQARAGSYQAASGRSGAAEPQVIVTLGPWVSLGAFDMLQRRPMGDEPRPRRSQYTFFGQQLLWCWSSWRSLCGAGGRDGSKVALGGLRGYYFATAPAYPRYSSSSDTAPRPSASLASRRQRSAMSKRVAGSARPRKPCASRRHSAAYRR